MLSQNGIVWGGVRVRQTVPARSTTRSLANAARRRRATIATAETRVEVTSPVTIHDYRPHWRRRRRRRYRRWQRWRRTRRVIGGAWGRLCRHPPTRVRSQLMRRWPLWLHGKNTVTSTVLCWTTPRSAASPMKSAIRNSGKTMNQTTSSSSRGRGNLHGIIT